MAKRKQYTFGSLFAGIGGICIGFSQKGFKVKWSNEIDKFACQTYRLNESLISNNLEITEGDIREFHPSEHVDVLGGGFPCQPYSVAGSMCGLNDKRGKPMFEELLRIASEVKPRAIFLENVGNLISFDEGKTFPVLLNLLKKTGYPWIHQKVLNSKDYSGIAQFRNRIYIVAFRYKKDFKIFDNAYNDYIKPIPIEKGFNEIVVHKKVLDKYYYSQDDKSKCISKRFHEQIEPVVVEGGIFYQYRRNYVRRNMNGLCPALTASMGGGGHNVPLILDKYGIRKLTPEECLRVQGFPDWFHFPDNMADGHKYRQAGNSVSVPVIMQYAALIRHTFEESDKKARSPFVTSFT